jgi:Mannitol repressor
VNGSGRRLQRRRRVSERRGEGAELSAQARGSVAHEQEKNPSHGPGTRGGRRESQQAIAGEKDLPCVLICGSFLDKALGALLLAHLVDGETSRQLIDPNRQGPLAFFRSRIDAAYCLGLISKGAFNNLQNIRQIRNLFAHSHETIDFADEEVAALCSKLTFPGTQSGAKFLHVTPGRGRFVFVTAWLFGYLTQRLNPKRTPRWMDFWDHPPGS